MTKEYLSSGMRKWTLHLGIALCCSWNCPPSPFPAYPCRAHTLCCCLPHATICSCKLKARKLNGQAVAFDNLISSGINPWPQQPRHSPAAAAAAAASRNHSLRQLICPAPAGLPPALAGQYLRSYFYYLFEFGRRRATTLILPQQRRPKMLLLQCSTAMLSARVLGHNRTCANEL